MKVLKLKQLALCAAVALGCASAPAFAEEATVKGSLFDISYVIGARLGDGTLSAEGENLRFRMRGLTILSAGISGGEFHGRVMNLSDIKDFEGDYKVGEAGAAYVIGAHAQRWINEKGVVIEVSGLEVGAELRLGGGALNVTLIDQPVEKPLYVEFPKKNEPEHIVKSVQLDTEEFFAFDSSKLSAKAMADLDLLVKNIKSLGGEVEVVMVTGHADKIGSESYNHGLALARATEVAGYLGANGLSMAQVHHVKVTEKGSSEPRVDCVGEKGAGLISCLAPNRRAEVSVVVMSDASK